MTWEQKELSGYPAMLSCSHDPIKSVQWTFQNSPGSVVKGIKSSGRFEFYGSSLIIHNVEAGDSGLYNCNDTDGELRALQLDVLGKLCQLLFTASCFKSLICYNQPSLLTLYYLDPSFSK